MMYAKDILRAQTTAITYHFFIHGPIEGSEDYIDLLDALYSATRDDVIILHLNTPGGHLNTAVEIIHAIAQTEATVVGSADGEVASAGSLIFFACHTFIIGEFCEVMIHDGSSGAWGKINENLKAATHTSLRLSAIYHKVYGRFLPEEEVQAILDGADLYMSAEDVELLIELAIESEEKEAKDGE